jgi:hypothetical protein
MIRIDHALALLAGLAGALGLIFLCFAPGVAAADECAKWNTGALWELQQDNGFIVFLDLDPNQTHGLRGKASYRKDRTVTGLVEGHVTAKKLVFTIHWDNGAVGGYEATISPQGRVEGFTYDVNNRGSTAGFRGDAFLTCVRWTKSAPPETPTPAPSSGRQQPSPDVILHGRDDQAGASPANTRCAAYAQSAVAQNRQNLALRCGFTGARWDANAANHENWCRVVDPALPASETAARAQDLEKCKQSKPIDVQQNRRIDDLLKLKPGSGGPH